MIINSLIEASWSPGGVRVSGCVMHCSETNTAYALERKMLAVSQPNVLIETSSFPLYLYLSIQGYIFLTAIPFYWAIPGTIPAVMLASSRTNQPIYSKGALVAYLQFLSAAETVTGSKHLINTSDD